MAKQQPSNARFDSLYVDADGVLRGYYVYVHRELDTGTVFYVGKGCGTRAWDTTKRHKLWIEKVATLNGRWEAVIVKSALTETEAFDFEKDLVDESGGAACDGGTLLNRVPGGEDPIAAVVSVALSEYGTAWQTAYDEARTFKMLDRGQQEQVARRLSDELKPVSDAADTMRDKTEDNDALDDSLMDVDYIAGSLMQSSKDFLRRRVSWKDFAIGIEEMLDEFDDDEVKKLHPKARPLAVEAVAVASHIFAEIDSGNRHEAEQIANRASENFLDESECDDE
jgi:hypothetical protein